MSAQQFPPTPSISMRWVQQEDGSYAVEMMVSGLASQQQAEAAMLHLQRKLCDGELTSN